MSTPSHNPELVKKVYAVLFSVSKRILLEDLARIVKVRDRDTIKNALSQLRVDLDTSNSPVALLQEGNMYKLVVRSQFMELVQKVVKQTELPKSVLETLAVIAYKAPMFQSDIVKIRTNKAYEHLVILEEKHFITKEKHGRTQLVRMTQKFFDYFEISPEELKKKFADKKVREDEHQKKLMETLESPPAVLENEGDIAVDHHDTVEILSGKDDELSEGDIERARSIEAEKHQKGEGSFKKEKITKEYEPPRVIGGFEEFSEEEKENIKKDVKEMMTGKKK